MNAGLNAALQIAVNRFIFGLRFASLVLCLQSACVGMFSAWNVALWLFKNQPPLGMPHLRSVHRVIWLWMLCFFNLPLVLGPWQRSLRFRPRPSAQKALVFSFGRPGSLVCKHPFVYVRIAPLGAQGDSPVQRFVQRSRMPRERLRLSSRRGGVGLGEEPEEELPLSAPLPQWIPPLKKLAPMGQGVAEAEEEAEAVQLRVRTALTPQPSHPSTRFRFPCSLDNATYFVSVRIEKCENAASPEVPAEPRPPSPVQCPRLQPAEASGAMAGPSEPAKDDAPYTDMSAFDQYGCRIVEEQQSTSVDA